MNSKHHNINRIITLTIALALLCVTVARADQSRTIRLANLATTVPAGLQVSESGGGAAVTDASQSFVAVIKPHSYQSFEALAQELNLDKDGFQLVGQVQSLGGHDRSFRAARQTPEGWVIADAFVRFSPYGGGGVVIVIAKEHNAQAAYYQGLGLAQRMQFSAASSAPAGRGATGGNAIAAALSGKHLLYLYTGNGYSERKDLFLYPNGQFVYRADASSLSMNGSGAIAGGSDGQWSVSADGQLVLQFNDGSVSQFTIAPGNAGNEILLNGRRVFVLND